MEQHVENNWEIADELKFTASGLITAILMLGVLFIADRIRKNWLFLVGVLVWAGIMAGIWRLGLFFGFG